MIVIRVICYLHISNNVIFSNGWVYDSVSELWVKIALSSDHYWALELGRLKYCCGVDRHQGAKTCGENFWNMTFNLNSQVENDSSQFVGS